MTKPPYSLLKAAPELWKQAGERQRIVGWMLAFGALVELGLYPQGEMRRKDLEGAAGRLAAGLRRGLGALSSLGFGLLDLLVFLSAT